MQCRQIMTVNVNNNHNETNYDLGLRLITDDISRTTKRRTSK